MRMTDKIVLITGVTSDIGTATVQRFAAEGATLVLTDLCIPGEAALTAMGAGDARHLFQKADLRKKQ